MFETMPDAQIRTCSDFTSEATPWRFVTFRGLDSWFYVTQTSIADGEALADRMIMISDIQEFLMLVRSPLKDSVLGKVFLVTPVHRKNEQTRDWEMHPLVAINEYRPEGGEPHRYALETVSTYVFSVPPDGIWERGNAREVYRTNFNVGEKLDDECLRRYERVMDFAVKLFDGCYEDAKAWVKTPLLSLHDLAPHDMLSDEQFERLQNLFGR
ncbi:hypothetical protein V476_02920 [Pseudomonas syringae KCTC 12500]|uniref:hypothetical protein n=1 Tax=Pseudomonas syringae group TaxID=136849 RepID=UPI00046A5DB6|nr:MULTISPECIES: hypothetical protein [Pseudomonas syringae group]KMY00151.1 hypothetical protein V476_02920 [Pseudomonas syringae KCTC 12500]POR83137.1 hypothetical protein BKM21_24245 [Pseudomonas syringae pv. syringae]